MINNTVYYTEAHLNLNFEVLHKLMFNETVRLEVFAVLCNWLNTHKPGLFHLPDKPCCFNIAYFLQLCAVSQFLSFLRSPWPAKILPYPPTKSPHIAGDSNEWII